MKKLAVLAFTLICVLAVLTCVAAEEAYTAQAQGNNGPVSVQTVIDASRIVSVTVIEHAETVGISDAAIEQIPAEIVAKQSLAIDTVSGATNTSNAILTAVADCLSQAGKTFDTLSAAVGENVSDTKLVPGVYASTQHGFEGDVTVYVTVDEDSILKVDVGECTEQPKYISNVAVKAIPSAIVASQSYRVDGVSGATFTGSAIMNAVKDALEQAGNAEKFNIAPIKTEKNQGADENVDVLVVGAGGSGILSALSAKQIDLDGADSELNVMLLEKQGIIGGSICMSGGSAWTTAPMDSLKNVEDGEKMNALYELFQKNDAGYDVNKPLLKNVMTVGGNTMMKLQRQGLSVVTSSLFDEADSYAQVQSRTTPYRNKVQTYVETSDAWYWRGVAYYDFFLQRLDASNIDLRLNTVATQLILDSAGAVVGAKVEGTDSAYNVYAKKVILACGGMVQNQELIAKYAPDDACVQPFANGGSDGDGYIMAEAVDAKVVGNTMMGYLGTDFRYGMWSDLSGTFHSNGNAAIVVNTLGERFVKDSAEYNLYVVYNAINQQTEKKAFAIVDSENPVVAKIEASTQTDYWWKADTIEEMAGMIGVDAKALVKTIDDYNTMKTGGLNDDVFGISNDKLVACAKEPYYAVALNTVAIGTLVGLDVTENCEVKNNAGDIVPNLYAVGEMSLGGNLMTTYIGAWGNAYALYSGRIAGGHAQAAILAE